MVSQLWATSLALLSVVAVGCGDDPKTVHAASSCPVEGCGGDVAGEWDIEAACIIEEDCAGESGTVSGTFTFGADSYSFDWLIETSGCGFRGESSSGGGGGYRAEDNFLYRGTSDEQIYEYCVDGDVLQLVDLDPQGGESFTLRRLTE